ncbi:MAG: Cytosol aminopeptidase [Smithella sp. PtaU1.Bin162]|nr:MAG: Cytosol aminopeptidase [Smithella sp. PtaU1.Bin162]
MKILVQKGKLQDNKSQAIILAMFQDQKKLTGTSLSVDQASHGLISGFLKNDDFSGKPSQIAVIYTCGAIPAQRIALVGLGKKSEVNAERVRAAFSKVMQYLRNINVKKAVTYLDFNLLPREKNKIVQAMVEGVLLGLYQYTPYKTVGREDIREMEQLNIVADESKYSSVSAEVKEVQTIVDAVCLARDLVSTPANEMTPSILAFKAKEIARRNNVTCKIIDRAGMKKLGMNSLLGVAAGSKEEPKFIILEYKGGKKDKAPVVLVGKGLTFDSGGISLKPAEKMDEMKSDMAGGAAVMATIIAAADLRLPINLVSLIPATENMPGGLALKPGDILKSYCGKTIEVINTDAEGRLILADALSYASIYKPAAVIDIATLTGACVIALGDDLIGMLGKDEKLKAQIKKAAKSTGEEVWELPLWDNYSELIKSDIADYKNTGGRVAGTITGALFLSKFVGDYPWVHLDIAGPAWSGKDKPYIPKGASGVAVRLLVEYLRNT